MAEESKNTKKKTEGKTKKTADSKRGEKEFQVLTKKLMKVAKHSIEELPEHVDAATIKQYAQILKDLRELTRADEDKHEEKDIGYLEALIKGMCEL